MTPIPNKWKHLKFWSTHYEDTYTKAYEQEEATYPRKEDVFNALESLAPSDVKVLIIGQDPYPTKGHAHGYAFSVLPHVKPIPASLRNIFTEYSSDLGYTRPTSGDLRSWSNQGVLLLNTCLTVCDGKPGSHRNLGWEKLTYEIVRTLSESRDSLVWMLWGKQAQELKAAVDGTRHLLICSGHPSPFSAKLFLGTKPFTKCNGYLVEQGIGPIDWRLR